MANLASETTPLEMETISVDTTPSSNSEEFNCKNEVLAQIQEKLKSQLLNKKNEVEDRIYEQKRHLLCATQDREEAGVQLYDLQCNLSSLYASLNKTTSSLTIATQGHTKAREEMDNAQKHWDARSIDHDNLTKKIAEIRQELDTITNSLKVIEKHNETLRDDVALNRRATYATEEALIAVEFLKKKQDIIIDECQERINVITNRVAMAKVQFEAQKRETNVANLALREADTEMGSIHAEKRQLTFQWNSTLVVLTRCNQAVKILKTTIHQQGESKLGIITEKKRYLKDTAGWLYLNDRAKFQFLKIDSGIKETKKYINFVTKKYKRILQQYAKVHIKVEKIQVQVELVSEDIKKIEVEIKEINKQYRRETTKIHELENKILTGLLEQVTLEEKGAKSTILNITELRKLVKDEDTIATDLNHELSRIRCDILAVQAYNEEVASTLKAVNNNVASKYNLISKFDSEIKQKGQEIDNKAKEIIKLTRKYEQLIANFDADAEASSPWEAMLYSLKQEINQKMKESNDSQKQWLSMQTSLVALQNDVNTLSEKAQRAAYDQGVLSQRKHRVDTQYNILAKAIKDLHIGIRQKQNLIVRLNDLIGKNKSLETSLLDLTENMQIQHCLTLKDLAKETMDLQTQLDNFIIEKTHANKHLNELEHHVMLWRYKISFEIESQAIIDPNVGAQEIAILRKSVGRMQFELDSLNFQRKKLIYILESKVDNRKNITSKIEGISYRKGIQGPTGFEAGLVRGVEDFKKTIRNTNKSVVECDKRLICLEEQKVELNKKMSMYNDTLSEALSQQENDKIRLKEAINGRSKAFLATALYQRLARKHEAFKSNKWKGIIIKKTINEDFKDAQRKGTTLIKIIIELTEHLPMMQHKLDNLIIQLELTLKAPQEYDISI